MAGARQRSRFELFRLPWRSGSRRSFAAPTPRAGAGWPRDRRRRAHADPRARPGRARRWPRSCAAIDRLTPRRAPRPTRRTRVLYVSPLKALGLRRRAQPAGAARRHRARGRAARPAAAAPTVAMRTGDTPQPTSARDAVAQPARHPHHHARVAVPDAHVAAREILRGVETVIVDEIHAMAATKRGAHLALSLERLERAAGRAAAAHRAVGDAAAAGGGRRASSAALEPTAAAPGRRSSTPACARSSTSRSIVPVEDMARARRERHRPSPVERPAAGPTRGRSGRRSTRGCSSCIRAAPLDDRLRQQPPPRPSGSRTGSTSSPARRTRPRPPRLDRPRAAARDRGRAQGRRAAGAGGHLVARAGHRHGRGRPGGAGRVAGVGRRAGCSGSVAPGTRWASRRRAGSSPSFAATCSRRAVVARRMLDGRDRDDPRAARPAGRAGPADRGHDRDRTSGRWTSFSRRLRAPTPIADLTPAQLEGVLDMLAGRYPSDEFAELRPRIVWDRAAGVVRGRDGAQAAGGDQRRHDPRPRPLRRVPAPTARGWASWTRRWCTRAGSARRSCWARPPGGSRRSPATGSSSRRRRASPARCRSGRATASAGRTSSGGRSARSAERDDQRDAAGPLRPRRRGRPTSPTISTTSAGHRRGAHRPHDRDRALPRRAGRLAHLRAVAVRGAGARAVGAGARGAHVRQLGVDVRGDVVRRRHRHPAARRRRVAADRPDRSTAGRARRSVRRPGGARARCSRRGSARTRRVRCCCRGAGPACARRCGSSAQGGTTCWQVAKRYGSFPIMLETYRECLRDVFEVPRLQAAAAGDRERAGARGRGRVEPAVAVRQLAAVRLHRQLHVRGRRAGRRAAGAGADARPRTAGRAAWRPTICASCSTPRRSPRLGGRAAGLGGHLADTAHDLLRRVGALTATSSTAAAPSGGGWRAREGRRAFEVGIAGEPASDRSRGRGVSTATARCGCPAGRADRVPGSCARCTRPAGASPRRTPGPFTAARSARVLASIRRPLGADGQGRRADRGGVPAAKICN